MNRMSKTVVREQVPPGENESASSSGVVPVVPAAKARPTAVPGVKAFAKSKSSTKSIDFDDLWRRIK